jgi:hypothetical protein
MMTDWYSIMEGKVMGDWSKYLRDRIQLLKTPSGGDIVVKLFPQEAKAIADRIAELENRPHDEVLLHDMEIMNRRIAELEAKIKRVEGLPDKWRVPVAGDMSLLGSARLSGASDARDKCANELKEALK